VPLSRNLGNLTSWNPLGPSGPVTRLFTFTQGQLLTWKSATLKLLLLFQYTGSRCRYTTLDLAISISLQKPSHQITYNHIRGFAPYRIMHVIHAGTALLSTLLNFARPIPSITMARATPCYTKLRTTMTMINVNDTEPNLLPILLNSCPFSSCIYRSVPTVPPLEKL